MQHIKYTPTHAPPCAAMAPLFPPPPCPIRYVQRSVTAALPMAPPSPPPPTLPYQIRAAQRDRGTARSFPEPVVILDSKAKSATDAMLTSEFGGEVRGVWGCGGMGGEIRLYDAAMGRQAGAVFSTCTLVVTGVLMCVVMLTCTMVLKLINVLLRACPPPSPACPPCPQAALFVTRPPGPQAALFVSRPPSPPAPRPPFCHPVPLPPCPPPAPRPPYL